MPKLFHLSCSPRADSESSAGAKVFVDRFREPADIVDHPLLSRVAG